MKRVLLLLPTRTYRAASFLAAAGRLGVEVVAASEEASALEESAPSNLVSFDFSDPESAAEIVKERGPFAAVLGVDDASVQAAARLAKLLGLRSNPPEAVDAARSKKLMREKFRDAGVRVPAFAPASAACPVPFPCVVKATSLSASRGVIRADDQGEYAAALARVKAMLEREGDDSPILVESFLPGPEVALDGLLGAGRLRALALFDKPETPDGPFFPETLFVTPSRLDPETQEAVRAEAEKAARAIGLAEGPVHAEFRVTPDGPAILELAARTIGGECGRALRFGAEASLEELVLRNALGLDDSLFERESDAAGVCMINSERTGVVERVEGVEAALAVPGVEDAVFPNRGERALAPLPEGGQYAGFLFARAKTPEAVEAALKAARSKITVVLR
jgi:biotin carboxylase